MRFLRLQARLDETFREFDLRRVVYELPAGKFKSGKSEDSVKGMAFHVQSWCEKNEVPYEAFSASEIKKHALGKGTAKKDELLPAAQEKWLDQNIVDHNQADALWLLDLAIESL